MSDVTQILSAIEQGDASASEELLPLIYEELRKLASQMMACEKPGQTLQATALVHEAYLRLVDAEKAQHWNSRGHFFAAAAEAMRRILVDRARVKKRDRHGGKRIRVELDSIDAALNTPAEELLELNDVLEGLIAEYPDCGEIVKLRFFAGMPIREVAETLGLPRRTVDRYWAFARAWLHQRLK